MRRKPSRNRLELKPLARDRSQRTAASPTKTEFAGIRAFGPGVFYSAMAPCGLQ